MTVRGVFVWSITNVVLVEAVIGAPVALNSLGDAPVTVTLPVVRGFVAATVYVVFPVVGKLGWMLVTVVEVVAFVT